MQLNLPRLERAEAQWATLGLLATGGALGLYGRFVEPAQLTVQRVTLTLRRLPDHLSGLTIAHVSDLHAQPHTQIATIARMVAQINALHADFIALTGDYVGGEVPAIFELAPLLGRLRARYGVAAVLGNHDTKPVPTDRAAIVTYALDQVGIPVLNNRALTLPNGLVVAGVEELYEGQPNLAQTLTAVPVTAPVVLLAHQPDYADIASGDPRVLLQLSGHTHAGQIRPPGLRPLYLPIYGRKYIAGLYRVGDLLLYVNRGIGLAYYLPFRLRCTPEITLITLQAI